MAPHHAEHGAPDVPLSDPYDKRRCYEIVLREGTAADVRKLSLDEIRQILPELWLPPIVRYAWEDYLRWRQERGSD